MVTHPDIITTVGRLERELLLQQVERRALVNKAAKQTRSARADVRINPAIARWGNLARAIQALRWVFRPSHT